LIQIPLCIEEPDQIQILPGLGIYVCFPASIAEACQIVKGEQMVWLIENRNTFVLKRKKKVKSLLGK
jgi:hypothetical protein